MTEPSWLTAVDRAVDLARSPVPDHVLAHTRLVVADTVGVAIAGGRSPEIRALIAPDAPDALSPRMDGGGECTLLSPGAGRTDPETAAFVNATAGTFLELDEGMRPTGHPGMHVVPAALAAAEALHADGTSLLRAVLAGYEVTARLFGAYRLRYPTHPHGHFGAVGAAVAVALLAGEDPRAAATVAATTPLLPVWDACYDGATTRNSFTGVAASTGVRSVRMARAGFTGSAQALDTAFTELVADLVDLSALTGPTDPDRPAVTRNYFKRHSACALAHGALDAILEMSLPPADEIDRIHVETVSNNLKIARAPRPNDLSARFSLPYAVAAAVTGRTDPEGTRYRSGVALLAERVEVTSRSDFDEAWPDRTPTRVVVQWDGGEAEGFSENPHGHHASPMTSDELAAKFAALVGDGAGELWHDLLALDARDDVGDLFRGRAA